VNTSWTWTLSDLDLNITMHRWGEVGAPVLVFPPDGVDAAELERTGLIDSLAALMADRRAKIYAVDSVTGRTWRDSADPLHSAWVQNRFGVAVRAEIVPRIWQDCRTDRLEIVAAGAALGAFEAVGAVCRYPDVFRSAVGMSGSYDLSGRLGGAWSEDCYFASPIHFLPGLNGDLLEQLRQRFVVLATGTGSWENPGESWWLADVLGSKAVPNRVDNWPGYARDWGTWRTMLPNYLDELLSPAS
jgi:esterase/lipase superfamily enzyme